MNNTLRIRLKQEWKVKALLRCSTTELLAPYTGARRDSNPRQTALEALEGSTFIATAYFNCSYKRGSCSRNPTANRRSRDVKTRTCSQRTLPSRSGSVRKRKFVVFLPFKLVRVFDYPEFVRRQMPIRHLWLMPPLHRRCAGG